MFNDVAADARECGFMGCGRPGCLEVCTPEQPTEATRDDVSGAVIEAGSPYEVADAILAAFHVTPKAVS